MTYSFIENSLHVLNAYVYWISSHEILTFLHIRNEMSRPPETTLVLSSREALNSNAVIGIDTQFLTVSDFLKGIKLIPAGIHLFHYSDSVDDGTSVRFGRWFECKGNDIISVEFKDDACVFRYLTMVPENLGDLYQQMVEYPEDHKAWKSLVNFVDTEVVEEFCPHELPVSTSTPLREENMVLADILMAKNPKQKIDTQASEELRYTIIQGTVPGETHGKDLSAITRDALDRSWYLQQLFGHDLELLLGELQLCFVHFIVLGNLCSCTQWSNLLKLVLMSASFLYQNHSFADSFLQVLVAQLLKIPPEYISLTLNNLIVDIPVYLQSMENLYHVFGQLKAWETLRRVNAKLGFDLLFALKVDDDNFEVFDLEKYDENDEDAPMVVF